MKAKFESNKFLVVNRKYLNSFPGWKCGLVAWALQCIEDKVPENHYYVCNQDEPYADKVLDVILKGETLKNDKT